MIEIYEYKYFSKLNLISFGIKKLQSINLLLCLFIYCLSFTIYSQSKPFVHASSQAFLPQWEFQDSGVNVSLRNIFFIDSLYGWAVGDSGVIVATKDGGMNWNVLSKLGDSTELKQVQFINRNIGFIGGNININFPGYLDHQVFLLRTLDGGTNWERIDSSLDSNFSFGALSFFNADTGWISINNNGAESWNERKGIILKTTNGGTTWTILREENFMLCESFIVVSIEEAYSFWSPFVDNFDDTYVYRTSDGGETWNWTGTIKEDLITEAEYMPPDILWAIGFKASLSQNEGKDWETYNWFISVGGEKRFVPTDIGLLGSGDVCLVGGAFTSANDIEGRILRISDSGENWWTGLQLLDNSFFAISVIDNKKAWLAGANGLIMHSKDILTDIETEEIDIPESFHLKQNYPNPFNSSTVIEYLLPVAGDVVFEIFDILGRRIKEISISNKDAGLHKIVWNATDNSGNKISSGIYIYQIMFNGISQRKKMILMQ